MTDIFHEVEEDLRRERLNKLWASYGSIFLTVAVLAVAATAGIVFWRQYQENQAEQTAEAFTEAGNMLRDNNVDGALAAFAKLAEPGGAGYPALAQFRQAGLLAAKGDLPGATAIYDKLLASNIDDRLKAIATLRSALTLADTEPPAQLKQRVAGLMGDDNPWRFSAREIAAYADYRAGDLAAAGAAYAALATDIKAPEGLRARAQVFSTFIQGGAVMPSAVTVSPPAAPATPAPSAPQDR